MIKRSYRHDLENAARQMIQVHRIDTLTRLILRTIVRNIHVAHAGVFFFDAARGEYIAKVTKGKPGSRIPAGFAKVSARSPVIRYFTDTSLPIADRSVITYDRVRYAHSRATTAENREFFERLLLEMSLFRARTLIPGFYRNDLTAIVFLGAKESGRALTSDEYGFLSVLASDVVMALRNTWLFEDLNQQLSLNKRLFLNTVTALAAAIDAKDAYTHGHTERVVGYAIEIARRLRDRNSPAKVFEENLRIAALLHDIGKIGIPESVLNKPGALNPEERACINRHPLTGTEILTPISEFKDVIVGVKYHHERFDGKGYPCGLRGDDIPLIASVIAVADTFDAMTTDRPYRKALSRETAVREIILNSGTQFNPDAVAAFLSAFSEPAAPPVAEPSAKRSPAGIILPNDIL